LAKFALAADKILIVRSALISLKAGEVEADDDELIKALRSALDVDEVKSKNAKSEPA
jgi:hypothetical protein